MPSEQIAQFLLPYAEEVGVELVDVVWDGRTRSLNVVIDCEGGLDIVTCEKFHRTIDGPLDGLDPTFGESYTLNCSSPGLDRPFKTERDFSRHLGEKVEVHLFAPISGAKYHEGVLRGLEGGNVVIETEKGELSFPLEKCSKVCLFIEV